MSKFWKRLQKNLNRKIDSALMIGLDPYAVDGLTPHVGTLFIVDQSPNIPRGRNILPIKDTKFFTHSQGIDLILINQGYDQSYLQFAFDVIRRLGPPVMLNQNFNLSKEYYGIFTKIKYEQLVIFGEYEIWKAIRK